MKVFVSQPMNGKPEEEILARQEELLNYVRKIFGDQVELVESYVRNVEDRKTPVEMLGESITRMAEADLVVFSHDWNLGRGCRVENMVAILYGMAIIYEQ